MSNIMSVTTNIILENPVFYITNYKYNLPVMAREVDAASNNVACSQRITANDVFKLYNAHFEIQETRAVLLINSSTILSPENMLEYRFLDLRKLNFFMLDPVFVRYSMEVAQICEDISSRETVVIKKQMLIDYANFVSINPIDSIVTNPVNFADESRYQITAKITKPVFVLDDIVFGPSFEDS